MAKDAFRRPMFMRDRLNPHDAQNLWPTFSVSEHFGHLSPRVVPHFGQYVLPGSACMAQRQH